MEIQIRVLELGPLDRGSGVVSPWSIMLDTCLNIVDSFIAGDTLVVARIK